MEKLENNNQNNLKYQFEQCSKEELITILSKVAELSVAEVSSEFISQDKLRVEGIIDLFSDIVTGEYFETDNENIKSCQPDGSKCICF